MNTVFLITTCFLSLFSKNKDKFCYAVLFLTVLLFSIADYVTYQILNVDYKTSIFIAMSFTFGGLIVITERYSKKIAGHSIILLLAVAVHFLQLVDITTKSNIVYDNYEIYIAAITMMHMVISYDSIHFAVSDAFKRILLLLRRGYLYYYCISSYLHEYITNKGGT